MRRRSPRIALALLLALAALAAEAGAAAGAKGPVSLDPYFGTGGVVSGGTFMPGFHRAGGIDVTARRNILLASSGEGGATLARFFPDGSLDSGYAGGVGVLQLPDLGRIRDVAARPDEGAYLLSGGRVVTRVTPDGSPAEGFGTAGSVFVPALDPRFAPLHFSALAATSDGGVLVAGIRFGSPRMVVVRLLENGTPDPSFGDDGLATVAIPGRGSGAFEIAVQPNGRIVLGGYALGRPALARLLANGRPDPSFGKDGVALAPARLRGRVTALSLRPQGGVLAAGPGIAWKHEGNGVFFLRYGKSGRLDRSFGPAGLATRLRRYATPTAVALVGDRVVLAATGPEPALQLYTQRGRPLQSLEGAPGVPSHLFAGIHAAQQGNKLLFTWTPEHHPGKGELRLERFLVH